jgi:hypothetical protein
MNSADLKDFERLLKICRKQGVTEVTMDALHVKFGDLPLKNSQSEDSEEIPTEELSPDELIYYAVGNKA